jgi:riboflavin biosynthesis pyrimidine reductase
MQLAPFEVLFDADMANFEQRARDDLLLPESLRHTYQGGWAIPAGRRYCYSNFALSRDGRVSFSEAGHMGGGDVSGFNRHDQWLMALLRARADAVVMGDRTLEIEPEHLWTSDYIYPDDATRFAELREREGRKPHPLTVFLSFTGQLKADASVFAETDMRVLIATTSNAAQVAKERLEHSAADVQVLALDNAAGTGVDLEKLFAVLDSDYSVHTILCEGGPRTYGSLLAAELLDEEFLALCPNVIGSSAEKYRPGLVEGATFRAGQAPQSQPLSMRKAGHHLFLRSKYVYA